MQTCIILNILVSWKGANSIFLIYGRHFLKIRNGRNKIKLGGGVLTVFLQYPQFGVKNTFTNY